MRGAALLLASGLGGCLQIEEIVTLFPDGSGKIELRMASSKAYRAVLDQKARAAGRTPPASGLPEVGLFFHKAEGIVALKPGPVTDDGAWERGSAIGYFDDANKVRIPGSKEGFFDQKYYLRATSNSLTLNNPFRDVEAKYLRILGPDAIERLRVERARFAAETQGMRITVRVVVPGSVTDTWGFTSKEGSAAAVAVDNELMNRYLGDPESDEARRAKEITAASELRVVWTDAKVDAERLAAWKAELAEVKATGIVPGVGGDLNDLTDDEVDRLFIEAQIKIAREQIRQGREAKARATLESVLKDYPKAKAAQEAKKLLEGLK
ncbi:MAG TPA: tetratricopeptide repeat protein [Planctomycetota bacterium]